VFFNLEKSCHSNRRRSNENIVKKCVGEITVWTVVQTVLTAIFNSCGDRQISTHAKSVPWTDREKTRHSLLRPRDDPLYQVWYKYAHWGLLGKWVKYNKKIFFIYTFFSQTRVQVRPVDGFLRAIAQKTWNYVRMCLFAEIKIKLNFKPIFIPKNRLILAQNGT